MERRGGQPSEAEEAVEATARESRRGLRPIDCLLFFLHAAILQVFPGLIRKFSKRSRIYLGSRVLVGVPGR